MIEIRLAPRSGGQSIGISALHPADIIVSTTSAGISQAIRFETESEVSHAILHLGSGMVAEAVREGVVVRTLHEALEDANLAVAYRRRGVPIDAALRIARWARAQRGKPYDATGALAHARTRNPVTRLLVRRARRRTYRATDRFFCSQLVLRAFAEEGYPIISGEQSSMTPDQLLHSHAHGLLTYVGHLVEFGVDA